MKSATYNLIVTRSSDVINELFFPKNRERASLDEYLKGLSTKRRNELLVLSPGRGLGFLELDINYPQSGNSSFATLKMVDGSELADYFVIDRHPVDQLVIDHAKRKIAAFGLDEETSDVANGTTYYFSFGVGDDIRTWTGPLKFHLSQAKLNVTSDGTRELDFVFTVNQESFRNFSNNITNNIKYTPLESKFDENHRKYGQITIEAETEFDVEGSRFPVTKGSSNSRWNYWTRKTVQKYINNMYPSVPLDNILVLTSNDLDESQNEDDEKAKDHPIIPNNFERKTIIDCGPKLKRLGLSISPTLSKKKPVAAQPRPKAPRRQSLSAYGAGYTFNPPTKISKQEPSTNTSKKESTSKVANSISEKSDYPPGTPFSVEIEHRGKTIVLKGRVSEGDPSLVSLERPLPPILGAAWTISPRFLITKFEEQLKKFLDYVDRYKEELATPYEDRPEIGGRRFNDDQLIEGIFKFENGADIYAKLINTLRNMGDKRLVSFERKEELSIEGSKGNASGDKEKSVDNATEARVKDLLARKVAYAKSQMANLRRERDEARANGTLKETIIVNGNIVGGVPRGATKFDAIRSNPDYTVETDQGFLEIKKVKLVMRKRWKKGQTGQPSESALEPLFQFAEGMRGHSNRANSEYTFTEENDTKIINYLADEGIIGSRYDPVILFGEKHVIRELVYPKSNKGVNMGTIGKALTYSTDAENLKSSWDSYGKKYYDEFYAMRSRTSSFGEAIDFGPFTKKFEKDLTGDEIIFMHNVRNANVLDVDFSNESGYLNSILQLVPESEIRVAAQSAKFDQILSDNKVQLDRIASYLKGKDIDDNQNKATRVSNIVDLLKTDENFQKLVYNPENQTGIGTENLKLMDFATVIDFMLDGHDLPAPGPRVKTDLSNRHEVYAEILEDMCNTTVKAEVKTLPFFNSPKIVLGSKCFLFGLQNAIRGSVMSERANYAVYTGRYTIIGIRHYMSDGNAYSEFKLSKINIGSGDSVMSDPGANIRLGDIIQYPKKKPAETTGTES